MAASNVANEGRRVFRLFVTGVRWTTTKRKTLFSLRDVILFHNVFRPVAVREYFSKFGTVSEVYQPLVSLNKLP